MCWLAPFCCRHRPWRLPRHGSAFLHVVGTRLDGETGVGTRAIVLPRRYLLDGAHCSAVFVDSGGFVTAMGYCASGVYFGCKLMWQRITAADLRSPHAPPASHFGLSRSTADLKYHQYRRECCISGIFAVFGAVSSMASPSQHRRDQLPSAQCCATPLAGRPTMPTSCCVWRWVAIAEQNLHGVRSSSEMISTSLFPLRHHAAAKT